jgi:hypothetical protein
LNNPLIPKDFYYVKCTAVEVIGDAGLPTVMIRLRVVPLDRHGDAGGKILHVTLWA